MGSTNIIISGLRDSVNSVQSPYSSPVGIDGFESTTHPKNFFAPSLDTIFLSAPGEGIQSMHGKGNSSVQFSSAHIPSTTTATIGSIGVVTTETPILAAISKREENQPTSSSGPLCSNKFCFCCGSDISHCIYGQLWSTYRDIPPDSDCSHDEEGEQFIDNQDNQDYPSHPFVPPFDDHAYQDGDTCEEPPEFGNFDDPHPEDCNCDNCQEEFTDGPGHFEPHPEDCNCYDCQEEDSYQLHPDDCNCCECQGNLNYGPEDFNTDSSNGDYSLPFVPFDDRAGSPYSFDPSAPFPASEEGSEYGYYSEHDQDDCYHEEANYHGNNYFSQDEPYDGYSD